MLLGVLRPWLAAVLWLIDVVLRVAARWETVYAFIVATLYHVVLGGDWRPVWVEVIFNLVHGSGTRHLIWLIRVMLVLNLVTQDCWRCFAGVLVDYSVTVMAVVHQIDWVPLVRAMRRSSLSWEALLPRNHAKYIISRQTTPICHLLKFDNLL